MDNSREHGRSGEQASRSGGPDGKPGSNDKPISRKEQLSQQRNARYTAYIESGKPFGPVARGLGMWLTYGTRTTTN